MKELVNVNVPKPKGVEEVKAPEEKKKTVGERIAEAREDAIVLEATEKAHGLGQGTGEQPESLAVQIVTKSMTQQAEAIDDMRKDAKQLQGEIKEANAAVGQMQTGMLQDLLARIEKAQTKLDESAKTAQAAGAPLDAFGYYKQVKGELSALVGEIQKAQPGAETQKPGISEATTIRLKELDLEQTRILHQIQSDAETARKEWDLKLLEFQDNKEVRHLEYQDKKHFREEGLQGVTDIVTALGAGIKKGGGPGNPGETTTVEPERTGEREREAGAYISTFNCSVCGTKVPVQDGQTVAQCPNPDCGAKFTIKEK